MRPWEQPVFELPAEEKIKLIRALWESIESEVASEIFPVSQEDIIEIQKRMDEYLKEGIPEKRGKS